MPLKIKTITVKGSSALTVSNLNVLVGANNSGKSQTLRDIRDYAISGSTAGLTIVQQLDVQLPSETESTAGLVFRPGPTPEHIEMIGIANNLQSPHSIGSNKNWIEQLHAQITDSNTRGTLLSQMGQFWCAFLDAESRFRLAAPTESYDTRNEVPSNALQGFFSEGKPALKKLRDAFLPTCMVPGTGLATVLGVK